jgi:hypothetical protein
MKLGIKKSQLGVILILGSLWGFSEAALGMGLRSCAAVVSGSIMTGVALFFMAATWASTRKVVSIALLIAVACLFKLFDAFFLGLPVLHGAVANPIFAFIMEGVAIVLLISIFSKKLKEKIHGQALLGGMAALVAVNLFPLVKFATGIPACVVAGTGYPLSLYYAPLAVALSLVTVPAGFLVGERLEFLGAKVRFAVSPAAVAFGLALIAAIRLI